MLVYRNLDLEGVRREYLPSLRVANFASVLDNCQVRGTSARAALPTERLVYGEHPDEWLWFTPGPSIDAPLIVFVHGGYWHLLSADDGSFLAPAVISAGCSFASVNYTLCPNATIETLIDQVRRAVEMLAVQRPVHLVGHSAGAHLAASVAGSDAPVAGYVFVSGVYDIRPLLYTPDNDDIRLSTRDAERWSPLLHHVQHGVVPAIVACGADESSEFLRQSDEWALAWGPHATSVTVAGRHHFDVLFDLFDDSTAFGAAVLAQVMGGQ